MPVQPNTNAYSPVQNIPRTTMHKSCDSDYCIQSKLHSFNQDASLTPNAQLSIIIKRLAHAPHYV